MPFKSKAQARWMWAKHPRMARRWSDETSKRQWARMPKRIKRGRR